MKSIIGKHMSDYMKKRKKGKKAKKMKEEKSYHNK